MTKIIKIGILLITLSSLLSGCSFISQLPKEKTVVKHQKEREKDSFKKNRLKTPDYQIELKASEIIKGYDDTIELLVLTYAFTNLSNDLLVPDDAFSFSFGAEQDLGNRIEGLSTSIAPYNSSYSKLSDIGRAKIKPDETLDVITVYELKDTESEIILSAYSSKSARKIGEKRFLPDMSPADDEYN